QTRDGVGGVAERSTERRPGDGSVGRVAVVAAGYTRRARAWRAVAGRIPVHGAMLERLVIEVLGTLARRCVAAVGRERAYREAHGREPTPARRRSLGNGVLTPLFVQGTPNDRPGGVTGAGDDHRGFAPVQVPNVVERADLPGTAVQRRRR